MAVKYTKKYASQAEYIYDLAKGSEYFDEEAYNTIAENNPESASVYANLAYYTKGKTSEDFDKSNYSLLKGDDKLLYLHNAFTQDKNETAIDENGKEYNVYQKNKEYLDYAIQNEIDKNIYDSLNWFERAAGTISGLVGDAISQVYSIGENIIDGFLFLSEGIGHMFGDENAAKNMRELAMYDTTGAKALQEQMNQYIKRYTDLDKHWLTQTTREITSSIANMAPLIVGNIVTGGASLPATIVYYSSMFGSTANQMITEHPDIDYGNLFKYTAGTTAIEFLTEWGSDKIFGGDTVGRMIFGGKATQTFGKDFGKSMFTEGLEEFTSELFGSLLYQATIDPNEGVSVGDLFHAAIIGSLVGGIMTGGSLLSVRNLAVTKDTGEVVDYKDAKEKGSDVKKLSKVATYNYKSMLQSVLDTRKSYVGELKAKYNQSIDELKQNHSEELEKAMKQDDNLSKRYAETALKLALFSKEIGIDGFQKAAEVLNKHSEKATEMVEKYLNNVSGENTRILEAEIEFNKANPGQNIKLRNLTNEEKILDKALYNKYGTHLYVGTKGEANGNAVRDIQAIKGGVFVDSSVSTSQSAQYILQNVVKQQLVNQILDTKGIMDNVDFRNLLNTISPEIKEITPEIRKTLTQMVLFDEITINKLFYTNKKTHLRIFKKIKDLITQNRTKTKSDLTTIEFGALLDIKNRYLDSVAKSIGNKTDLDTAKVVYEMNDDEYQNAKDKIKPNYTNKHYILMKNDYTPDALEKTTVEMVFITNRKGDQTQPINYDEIYNPAIYKDDFKQQLAEEYPGQSFEDALWNYVSDNYGYSISKRNGTVYKQVDLVEHSTDDFIVDVDSAKFLGSTEELQQYDKVDKILDAQFLSVFNTEDLDRITITYTSDMAGRGSTQIFSDGTIKIRINTNLNMHDNGGIEETIYHEISHALAYIQGFPTGTSHAEMVKVVGSLRPSALRELAIKMCDKEFLETADDLAIEREVAYGIYFNSSGERYARGTKESLAKPGDGFDVGANHIIGFGKYRMINGMPFIINIPTTIGRIIAEADLIELEDNKKPLPDEFYTQLGDNLQEQGFSKVFLNYANDKALTKGKLWALLGKNKIGSQAATDKIIKYLAPDNENIKNMDDALLASTKLAIAKVYFDTHPDKASATWDEMENYFKENNNKAPMVVSGTEYKPYDITEQYSKFSDITTNNEVAPRLYEILIRNDVDVTKKNKIDKVINKLYSLNKSVEKQSETMRESLSRETAGKDEKTYSKYDEKSLEQWQTDEIKEKAEENKLTIEDEIKKRIKTYAKDINEWLLNKGEVKDILDIVENARKNLKEGKNIFNTKNFTREVVKSINADNQFEVMKKLKNNKEDINKAFGENTYENVMDTLKSKGYATKDALVEKLKRRLNNANQITNLSEAEQKSINKDYKEFTTQKQFIKQIENIDKIINEHAEDVVTSPTTESIVKTTQENIQTLEKNIDEGVYKGEELTTAKEQLSEQKQMLENVTKRASENDLLVQPEEVKSATITRRVDASDANSIADGILETFEDSTKGITDQQYFDNEQSEYYKVSYDMITDNAPLFASVNDDNYDQVRKKIANSKLSYARQALMIFDLYTTEFKGKFSKKTQDKIENNIRPLLTEAAQREALQAKRVLLRGHTIQSTVNYLRKQGYDVEVTDEMLIALNEKLADKEKYIAELQNKVKALDEELKKVKNDADKATVLNESKELSQFIYLLQNGDNAAIADFMINHVDDLIKQSELTEELFSRLMQYAKKLSKPEAEISKFHKFINATKSFRLWAMLTSPVTWFRNYIGNKGMQALDAVTNTFERFISKQLSFDERQMAYNETKAGSDLYNYIAGNYKTYINQLIRGETGKYHDDTRLEDRGRASKIDEMRKELKESKGFGKVVAGAKFVESWGLETGFFGDEKFMRKAIAKNFANLIASNTDYYLDILQKEYNKLSNRSRLGSNQEKRFPLIKEALNTKNAIDILKALDVDEVTRLFVDAKGRAAQQYFKNTNGLSRMLGDLSRKHPMAAELISWIMPFPKVAANILTMAYKYSPLNFVNSIVKWSQYKQTLQKNYQGEITGFEKADFIHNVSQATTGTFLLVAGVLASLLGWIDIDDDDYLGPAIKIGDLKIGLANLAPSMTVFSTAAAVTWAWNNGKGFREGAKQGLNVLYDSTLLGNLENIFRYGSFGSFAENLSISYLSQYIPNILKLMTKYAPTKDKSGSYFPKLIKTLASYVPGVNALVPDKIDPYTGKKVYSTGVDNGVLNLLFSTSPLSVKVVDKTPLEKEAERLGAETTGLKGNFTINGEDYEVSGNKKMQLAKYRANYIQSEYDAIVNNKKKVRVKTEDGRYIETTYDKLTDTQKKNVIQNMYSNATDVTKVKYWVSEGHTYRTSNKDEYDRLKKVIGSGIQYVKNWSKSKFVK